MICRIGFRSFASSLALAAAFAAMPAHAQDDQGQQGAADAVAAEDPAAADGDIVVTAQRRAESIQDVPISIAAFSGETLAESNVFNVQDLARLAPNFQATKGVQSSFLRVNIRGIGAGSNTTIEPSVAIFVDGIYVPRAGAIVGSFLDMERVEVLRGPQGTLFGRNASVGALSLRTAAPENEFSARVTGEVGTGERYKLEGYVNLPLSDTVAIRVAGMSQWFGGYWTNRLDGRQYGGADDQAVRASLRAEFGNLEWIVRADWSHTGGDGVTNVDFDPSSVTPAQLEALRVRLGGVLPDTNLNDRIMNQVVTADLDDRQWGVSSQLSLDLNGSTVRLINSYRDWRNDQLDGDVVFVPVPVLSRVGNYRSQSHNHELQFISPTRTWLDGRLDLVAGLYWFSEDYRLDEQLQMGAQFCNVVGPTPGFRAACNAFLTANGGANASDQDVLQQSTSIASYAQATFRIADPLAFTAGVRWTHDEKEGSYAQRVTNQFIGAIRAPEVLTFPDLSESELTYRFSLTYEPNRDLMFFANYSTGYKSGGYNSGAGAPPLSTFDAAGNLISTKRVFGRETVDNYEVGARTSWLGGALTANVTIFRMDIGGYQDRAFDGQSFTVRNAGNLRQQGVEADFIVAPVRDFTINAAVGLLDSSFTSYPNAAGLPGLGGVQDLTGKPVTFSPSFTGRVGFDWSGDLGTGGMRWHANANLAMVSDQYMGLANDANPQTIEDGYFLLGARFTVDGPNERWSVSVFGNNLTNSQYAVGNLYQTVESLLGVRNGIFPGSTAVRRVHADPRTLGAAFTVRF